MRPLKINHDLNLKERISSISSIKVIYVRLVGDYKTNDYRASCQKLMDYLCQSEFFRTEMKTHGDSDARSAILRMFRENTISSIGIYHDDPKITENEKLRADICLSVPVVMNGSGDVGFKEIEGGKYVIYLYQGPYQELGSVYDTVYGKYIPDGGYQIDMRPGFEIYLNDPESTPPEKLLTEIYVPIK
jgi:AraC family transcriptional regulator